MTTPYFAAVAAVRIQAWISRTPDLRYVRGASHALTEETSRSSLTSVLPDAAFDADTAEVAGVCVLRADDAETIDRLVDFLLLHLQQRLPGVEWSAWRANAPSYVMAYDLVNGTGDQATGGEIRHWPKQLPLILDLPFARACARCAHELATTEVYIPGEKAKKEGIGPDCHRRHRGGANYQFQTFDDLAALANGAQTRGRRDADNHLATVCADGNLVGDFFTAVAALRNPRLQAVLSNALDQAAHTAVDEASECGHNGQLVAMKHFVGGDDIFASVAAPYAWPFVETLGRVFEEKFRENVNRAFEGQVNTDDHIVDTAPTEDQIQAVRQAADRVSLGIGVAFAHKSHPIADCRETAAAAERAAKVATRGRAGAVSWIDITVEPSMGQGSTPVPQGRFVTIDQLGRDLDHPHPALTMNPSARAVLASLLRPHPKRAENSTDLAEAVRAWAKRVGRLGNADNPEDQDSITMQVTNLEPHLPEPGGTNTDELMNALRHTVDRARWWPDAHTDDTDPAPVIKDQEATQ